MLYKTKLWIGIGTGVAVIGGGIYCFALKPTPKAKNKGKSSNGSEESSEESDDDEKVLETI